MSPYAEGRRAMVGFRGFVEGGSRLWSRGVNGAVSALTRSRVISHIGRVGGFRCFRRAIWLVRARVGRVRGLAGAGECQRWWRASDRGQLVGVNSTVKARGGGVRVASLSDWLDSWAECEPGAPQPAGWTRRGWGTRVVCGWDRACGVGRLVAVGGHWTLLHSLRRACGRACGRV